MGVPTSVISTTTLSVSARRDPSCFALEGWSDLLANDPHRHIFATPQWSQVWWDEFGRGKDLIFLTMHDGTKLRAIVPLYRKKQGSRHVLRFVGGIDLTDYLGPICSLEDRGAVAAALIGWLQETEVAWDEFDAHNMPVPFGFADFLVERADAARFDFRLEQEETAAILLLPSTWEVYLASLGSKERHELKRKQRRLLREHPDVVFRTTQEDRLERDLESFVRLHRGAEGMKGHFMRPEVATFFERVAHDFMPRGWLRLEFLEVGGDALAATFGFVLNDTYFLYNSAIDEDAKRLSPGLMLVSELVRRSIDEGMHAFDFLRGPERYKYQLGAEAVPLNNVRVIRS